MSKEDRKAKIAQLEKKLNTRIICFITSDRPNLEPQASFITRDCIKVIEQHLSITDRYDSLSLYLISHGGDTDVPWPLVNLLRAHCKRLDVLIPYICHSAATMIALGCDRIIAGPRAQLSPTDPSLTIKMGTEENSPVMQFGVEDVNAFINFAKTTLGSRSFREHGHEALARLIDHVKPPTLGSISRHHYRTGLLIEKLLGLTAKRYTKAELERKTTLLTTAYCAHTHFISRGEMMSELGLPVTKAEDLRIEGALWELYEDYAKELQSRVPFEMQKELNAATSDPTIAELKGKFVESEKRTDVYIQRLTIQGAGVPNFNFALPQVPGLDTSVVQQIFQNWIAQLSAQLKPLQAARKVSSFGEWRSE